MGNLTFTEKGHEYRLDGLVLPSVTQIISDVGLSDFSRVNKELLDRSVAFGSAVHETIRLKIKGTLDESTLDEHLVPYLRAWEKFYNDFSVCVWASEEKGHNPTLRYAYRFDYKASMYCNKKTGIYLIDIKTGHPKPADRIQLAGYRLGVQEKVDGIMLLYLNPDIKPFGYKVDVATYNKKDEAVFISALNIWNFRKEHKLL